MYIDICWRQVATFYVFTKQVEFRGQGKAVI